MDSIDRGSQGQGGQFNAGNRPAFGSGNAGTSPTEHQFEFTGSGGEYFRIWIVNLLLTVLTLGIYGAWAKVRRLRYFHGNTQLAGSSFEYHGEPKKILKGRAIAAALIAPYYLLQTTYPVWSLVFLALFLILLPYIIIKSRQFQMRMTSWRNIHFGFDGSTGAAAKIYLGLPLLVPFTLGLITPYVIFSKQRFILGNTRFGQTRFDFEATAKPYYRTVLSAFLWFLAACVVLALLVAALVAVIGMVAGFGNLMADPRSVLTQPGTLALMVIAILVLYWAFIAVMLVPAGVANAGFTNTAFNHTSLDGHQLKSQLQARKLVGLYLTNLLGIVLTLGLFSPWAKVRLLRYQLANTSLVVHGNLDEFVAAEADNTNAIGEEAADLLDVDFGL